MVVVYVQRLAMAYIKVLPSLNLLNALADIFEAVPCLF